MRLDIFVPFLKKAKGGVIQTPVRAANRLARRVLPKALFSDLVTGKPGLVRRWLKWAGPSWLSAPVRRTIQGICLVAFLVLFFYVCWPYTARPARTWENWVAIETDAAARTVTFVIAEAPADVPHGGRALHLVDTSIPADGNPQTGYAGKFRVAT